MRYLTQGLARTKKRRNILTVVGDSLVQPLWETAWKFLKEKGKLEVELCMTQQVCSWVCLRGNEPRVLKRYLQSPHHGRTYNSQDMCLERHEEIKIV